MTSKSDGADPFPTSALLRQRQHSTEDRQTIGAVGDTVRRKEVELRKLLKLLLWQALPSERTQGHWGKYGDALKRGIDSLQAMCADLPAEA